MRKIKLLFPILILFFSACKEMKPVSVSAIESARIIKMASDGMELELNIKIKNPNNFGFNIYRSDFDVKFSNVEIGTAHLKKKVHINANSEITHSFIITSDLSKIIGGGLVSIMLILQKKNTTVNIKGDIVAGKIFYKEKFPIDFNENISIDK